MAQSDPLIGQQIGNYQIMAPIAAGAFGVVYKARHQHIQERVVAIKTLHIYLASSEEHTQFSREAQILERLRHPYILSLLDFRFFQNRPYLITTYASGGSLRQLLRSAAQKPLPWELALRLLQQAGQGLHYAHQQRIIHRDLKPENILLSEQQEALIADFGISSMLTSTSSVAYSREIGTPAYMAPEQFRGEMSAESDQYALACMAYEMVTGHRPFQAANDAVGFMHVNTPPPALRQLNPHVLPHVEQAILRALAKERRGRFPDIAAFLDALRADAPTAISTSAETITSAPNQARDQGETTLITPQKSQQEGNVYTLKHLLDIGNSLYKQDNYEQALTAYERALQSYPRSVDALKGKGDILRKLKRHMDALAVYDQALDLDPNGVAVLLSKGQLFGEIELHQEALATFDQAVSHRPNDPVIPLVLCAKAAVLLKLGYDLDAYMAYSQALDSDPRCAEAKNGKEKLLLGWKDLPTQQALSRFDEAFRLRPGDGMILAYNSDTLARLGRYEDAFALYDQAQELDPGGGWKNRVPAALRRYKEEIDTYNRALEKHRRNRPAKIIGAVVSGGATLLCTLYLIISGGSAPTGLAAESPEVRLIAWITVLFFLTLSVFLGVLLSFTVPPHPYKNPRTEREQARNRGADSIESAPLS